MKRIIVGACAIMLLSGVAFAQTSNTTPPPPAAQDQQVDGPQDGDGWFGWGRKHGRNGHGRHGPGHGRMMMGQGAKGIHIMVGPGQGLHINCGDEPMKECIASAQPLIDAFNKSAPKALAQ